MAIANFIPSVWSAEILRALDTLLVYANPAVINRDYEGQIANHGDNVRINTLSDVTVSDYTRNTDIAAPETLTDAQLTLTVDQGKTFNFQYDDLDALQANADLRAEAQRRAAYALRKTCDSYVAGLYTEIASSQFTGDDTTPIADFDSNSGRAYDKIVDLATLLNNTDTPEDGRFVVIPPWYEGYLQKDSRFTGYGTAANRQQLQDGTPAGPNGLIGRAAGFDVYRSNQVPNTSSAKFKIIAGHRSAWSMATQLVKVEPYRLERRFADGVKALHVYGAKVVRPYNLACLVASDT